DRAPTLRGLANPPAAAQVRVGAVSPPPRIVRRVNNHDATSFSHAMLGDSFDLAIDLDTAAGHWFSHQDGLAGETERYRVPVAAIAEHAVVGHAAIFYIAGVVIGLLVNEPQPFLRQALVGTS